MTRPFSTIAGHPALDLLNTVRWRLDPALRSEDLDSWSTALDWCLERGFLDASERQALGGTAGDQVTCLDDLRDLREACYRLLVEHDPGASRALAEHYRRAIDTASLQESGGHWQWVDREITLDTPRARIARELVALVQDERIGRLRQCEDEACGWVFLDTSPRHNRRWCAANDCGDRNRARLYYHRHKGTTSSRQTAHDGSDT